MSSSSRKVQFVVWGGLSLVIAGVAAAFLAEPSGGSPAPPAPSMALPVYSRVPEFTLTNQLGAPVRLADLRGQVWLADIIFTRCPGPCRRMTRQMAELQALLPAAQPVKLVTLTTDPEYDSPEMLRRFGDQFQADAARWWFLTGTKDEIRNVAVAGLKFAALEKDPAKRESENDLFIHATLLALVDKQGQVRATFQTHEEDLDADGLPLPSSNPEAAWKAAKGRISEAVAQLLAEP